MKISTILDKVDENQLFVPAFQREYVWKRDDAKQLLDSLIKQYPVSYTHLDVYKRQQSSVLIHPDARSSSPWKPEPTPRKRANATALGVG